MKIKIKIIIKIKNIHENENKLKKCLELKSLEGERKK